MTSPALRMCFADRAALERELETNLKLGRAFVRDAQNVEVLADCALVLVHPDDGVEHTLRGQAVLVSDAEPMRGVGVQLRPFDAAVIAALEAFVRGERSAPANETAQPVVEPTAAAAAPEPEPSTGADAETDEADALLAGAEPAGE